MNFFRRNKNTKDPERLDMSFSNSVSVAIEFVYGVIHRRLPKEVQQHIVFDWLTLEKGDHLHVYRMFDPCEFSKQSCWRTLKFEVTASNCLTVQLQKNEFDRWEVVAFDYPRKYRGEGSPRGGYSVERYRVIIKPFEEYGRLLEPMDTGFVLSSY